jgi:predicted TIM-barrel fold metal-dependent hydrolase
MVIDVHVHIGKAPDTAFKSVPQILRGMRAYGVSKSVIFPINEVHGGPSYERSNQKVLALVKKHKNLIGCFRLHPKQMSAAFRQLELLRKNDLHIVKLHPRSDHYGPKVAAPLFPEICRNKFSVIIHTDHEEPASVTAWLPIFKAYPKTNFILTHGGKDRWRDAIHAAQALKNIYLDTSTLSFYRTGMILKGVGVRKVLFGSDTPYSHVDIEMRKFKHLLSRKQLRFVLSENAKHVLNL